MLTSEQESVIKDILEMCEAVPHNTKRVYETIGIDSNGEVVTHIDREQWLESIIEVIEDKIGQEFDIMTDSTLKKSDKTQ